MIRKVQFISVSLLFFALLPGTALAEVCDKIAPAWDPNVGPVTQFGDLLIALQTPIAIGLVTLGILAIIIKNIWLPLIAALCFGGAGTGLLITWFGSDGVMRAAISEGCRSTPELLLAILGIAFFAYLHLAVRRALPLLFGNKSA